MKMSNEYIQARFARLQGRIAEGRALDNRLADILLGLASTSTPAEFWAAFDRMRADTEEAADVLENSDRRNDPAARSLMLRLRNRKRP